MTKKIRVLFVDDDARTRDGYREFFELSGLDVDTAADGGTALELLSSAKPDVIVLDLELPVIDGWEVARRAKLIDGNTRIVALTGRVSSSERASAVRAGCDLYVTKPCAPNHLVDQIRKLLAS